MTLGTEERDFITLRYDGLLLAAGESMTMADIREALIPDVEQMLAAQPRNVRLEAENLVRAHLNLLHPRRANRLRRDLAYIVDYWHNPDEGAVSVEALMELAYPLGTSEGAAKSLGMWTAEDLNGVILGRYREASQAMRAAREFDDVAQQVVTLMAARGALRIRDAAHPVVVS